MVGREERRKEGARKKNKSVEHKQAERLKVVEMVVVVNEMVRVDSLIKGNYIYVV